MAQLFPVAFALPVAYLLGGRLHRVGRLELRGVWLFFLAIAIQVVAFPFAFLPWTTGGDTAKALWLVSYGCLLVAAVLNRRILGAQIVAVGMALNLTAILANGGRMPATPEAMEAAGLDFAVRHNSVAAADPAFPLLVDRFAAPEWVPWANVFSVGDVVIAIGSIVLVFAATGARVPDVRLPAPARRLGRGLPGRRAPLTPADIASRDLSGLPEAPAQEPAQVVTVPAPSVTHTSDLEHYAGKRVEARGGPTETAAADRSRPFPARRSAWIALAVVGTTAAVVVVHRRHRRRSR